MSLLGIAQPTFASSSTAEFVSVLDGSWFTGKPDSLLHYGQVKYLGALWMAALARRHPQLRLITISPGNTSGTAAVEKVPLVPAGTAQVLPAAHRHAAVRCRPLAADRQSSA